MPLQIKRCACYTLIMITLASTSMVTADTIELSDGSRLVGKIIEMDNKQLIINTAFSDNLEIKASQVKGITTDEKVSVTLSSGDRVNGRLQYSPDGLQQINDTLFGNIKLDGDVNIAGVNDLRGRGMELKLADRDHQEEVDEIRQDHQQEKKALKADYEKEIAALKKEKNRLEDTWSGNIAFGITGHEGNTEEFNVQGRGELYRETEFDRFNLYAEGNLQQQNGDTTTNEVFAGAKLERDLTRRWFAFGSLDFEKDEFENLSLRGVAMTGIGYFFIRRPNMHLKGLVGVGYQHESFTNGTTLEEGIMSAGYDFFYDYNDWLRLGHKVTYFPSFSAPGSDYRLNSDALAEMPLVKDESWKVRFNLRNQYDSAPQPGVENLDTSYLLNLVYDWE